MCLAGSCSQYWSDAKEERREGKREGLPGHMQPLRSHVTPEYMIEESVGGDFERE